jgi:hypothetical protein
MNTRQTGASSDGFNTHSVALSCSLDSAAFAVLMSSQSDRILLGFEMPKRGSRHPNDSLCSFLAGTYDVANASYATKGVQ